jgi:biopolymer transport protein ExbB
MTVLSTMVSLGTLAGLLGTVTGMIKAFSALSAAGTQIKLLLQMVFLKLINTATGISTSALQSCLQLLYF